MRGWIFSLASLYKTRTLVKFYSTKIRLIHIERDATRRNSLCLGEQAFGDARSPRKGLDDDLIEIARFEVDHDETDYPIIRLRERNVIVWNKLFCPTLSPPIEPFAEIYFRHRRVPCAAPEINCGF